MDLSRAEFSPPALFQPGKPRRAGLDVGTRREDRHDRVAGPRLTWPGHIGKFGNSERISRPGVIDPDVGNHERAAREQNGLADHSAGRPT